MNPVVIVGAGLSGVATGVHLSRQNIPVLLLEQRPHPGGRTRSFRDGATGETLDNGQHVLIAGYDAAMRYLSAVGTRDLLRIQTRPRMLFHHPVRGFCTFGLPAGRPPWNLVRGIMASDLFSLPDSLRLIRAGGKLLRWSPQKELSIAEMSIDDWLRATGQSAEMRRSLWEPLAVAIMNEHCSTASALVFLRTLRKAFFGHWQASAFAVPTVGLSELLITPGINLILKNGGRFMSRADVVATVESNGRVDGVRTRDGSVIPAHAVVLAVPSDTAHSLLPNKLRESGFLAGAAFAPLSPILSIYLWFEHDFMGTTDILGLVGRNVQWVFNRRSFMSANVELVPRLSPGLVCCVISAAHDLAGRTNEELAALAREDLRSVYGERVEPALRFVVLRERKATFSSSAAFERQRPTQQTPVRNLFLAGDWTATGLPATVEGAVLSAERCAALVQEMLRAGGAAWSGAIAF